MTTPIVPVAFTTPIPGNVMLRAFGVAGNGQPSGEDFYVSAAQIASLANTEDASLSETAVSATTGTTLTGAALVSGQIARTGPTAAFTDTTDTAANILAQLPGAITGSTFLIRIKNATAFTETLAAGSNVTLPASVIIPPYNVGLYWGTVSSATTVTLVHMQTSPFRSAQGVGTSVGGVNGGTATGTFSQASNTTLSTVTGMAASVVTGGIYKFEVYAPVTNSATGGVNLALTGITVSSIEANTLDYNGTTINANTNITAISSSLVNSATACTLVISKGSFTASSDGTLQVQAAQTASNSTATTVTNGAYLSVTRLS